MRLLPLVLCLLVSRSVTAQHLPIRAVFDPARVVQFRDSFALLVQGEARGTHVYVMERTSTGYLYQDRFSLQGFGDRYVRIVFDSQLAPISSQSSGTTFGKPSGHEITFQGSAIRGQRILQGDSLGAGTVPVRATLPPGAIEGQALMGLLSTLDWLPGRVYAITMYDVDEDRTTTQLLRMGSVESLTVPAGRVEAIVSDLSTTQAPVRIWMSASKPHRLLKISAGDGAFATVLVAPSSPTQ